MIVIIDNYDSFTYNLYQMVAQMYADVRVIRNDQITVAELKAMRPSGIMLSPGPGRPESAGICIALIQSLDDKIPLMGVCLGLQAIVSAFAGNIVHAPTIVHGKSEFIFHNRKHLYHDLPLPFQAGRYHSLMAEKETLPAVLEIEAQTSAGVIMGIRHVSLPIFGVQFHPESILTPQGSAIVQHFIALCDKEGALCA